MPKMKTHKGAKARIKLTGTGKLRRLQQMNGHLFNGRSQRQLRRLEREVAVAPGDAKIIKRMIGKR